MAELPRPRDGFRAYVMVLPIVPDVFNSPEAWLHLNSTLPGLLRELKDPRCISGYEIRYLEHDEKYTESEWGADYDYMLADRMTRVRRLCVRSESDIPEAIAPWLTDLNLLHNVFEYEFDSSLVHSQLDRYLEQTEKFPHLWL